MERLLLKILDTLLPLPGLLVLYAGFFAYLYMVFLRTTVLSQIKLTDSGLYRNILSPKKESWLDRGWIHPGDYVVIRNLHPLLYKGTNKEYLTNFEKKAYRLSTWLAYAAIFLFILIMATILLLLIVHGVGQIAAASPL